MVKNRLENLQQPLSIQFLFMIDDNRDSRKIDFERIKGSKTSRDRIYLLLINIANTYFEENN